MAKTQNISKAIAIGKALAATTLNVARKRSENERARWQRRD